MENIVNIGKKRLSWLAIKCFLYNLLISFNTHQNFTSLIWNLWQYLQFIVILHIVTIVTIFFLESHFTYTLLEPKLILILFSTTSVFWFFIMFYKKSFKIFLFQVSNRLSSKPKINNWLAYKRTSNIKKMCINKHIGNIIKFRSIGIALWIEKG